ncbi:uncharacterized protein LOC128301119 isoform X1 [Anopheles moucheti]|uniref:uncharacterized protein LOC128301119 isoform X1 n=2 Tax=Anopheles moucheti TaxID=186751 RepID=UPI0022EFE534|nr:uncharacterized protein LOC128301119 isoform X1 [Anopheles moucheti]
MVNYTSVPCFVHFYQIQPDDRYSRIPRKQQMCRWDMLHSMKWELSQESEYIPPSAVECGTSKRTKLYLGRAEHAGSITPGFIDPAKKVCFIPWGGEAHEKKVYEFLCTPGEFVPCTDTNILMRATPAGVSEEGEPLYIGRVNVNGKLVCGKVQRSHAVCYIPLNRKEMNSIYYDVFIRS